MTISKKAAQRIASLINEITVANLMIDSLTKKQDWRMVRSFCQNRDAAIVSLSDEFGINLPNLDRARQSEKAIAA